MDVERVMHRVVLVEIVDEANLHVIPNGERPVDLPVGLSGVAIDELPDHVARVGRPVDVWHQVLPLQTIGRVMRVRLRMTDDRDSLRRCGDKLHPALGARS